MKQELKNKRKHYYNKLYVQYELLNAMRNREVSFIDTDFTNRKIVRGMFIRNISNLEKAFKIFNFFNENYNIYISVAQYKHIPIFTPDLTKRSAETSEWYNEQARNEIEEYDLLLDFDCKNTGEFSKMKEQVTRVVKSIDINNIIFYFYPSGNNFQIILPSEYLPPIMIKSQQIVKNMIDNLGISFLDLKGIGVFNKLMKCPYSLVEDKVCLPMSNISYFENHFNYEDMDSNKTLGTIQIKKRGLCQFNLINNTMSSANFIQYLFDYNLDIGLDLEVH